MNVPTISYGQARRAAVAAQGLDRPRPAPGTATLGHLDRVLARTALLQIDSVNVLARAHLLPLFARLGPYDVALVDRAAGRAPRRLVEYWAHEASYIPATTYPLLGWRREAYRRRDHWGRELSHHPGLVAAVRQLVAEAGPVTAREVHDALGHRRGPAAGWGWNWTPAKHALEHLFDIGEIAVAHRTAQFERAYDLPARVLPPAVLARPVPAEADAIRALLELSARAHGVAGARALADYFRLPRPVAARATAELVEAGTLVAVRLPGAAGPVYRHVDARLPRRTAARALLAPFDPLVFERRRLLAGWGMHYRIGIYTPAHRRSHGYYVLPFLLGEHLVARVDLKADRAAGVLVVRAAHAEEPAAVPGLPRRGGGAWPESGLVVTELAAELVLMAGWLGLSGVRVAAEAAGDLARELVPVLARAG